ncbi:MAG: GDP-mannose 4,6-dehydratase [Spirochaetaceae bacterium]
MNIMVTGAAGFIGSHVADFLVESGHVVYGIDNFDPFYPRKTKERNLEGLMSQSGFRFFEIDLLNQSRLNTVFERALRDGRPVDCVIHLAAKAGVRPSIEDPVSYTKCNVEGTVNVMEAMAANDIQDLIFASSSSVYGNTEEVPFKEDAFVDHPISPYAATKKACELLCHTYTHLHLMRVACLRFFTVYGPRQRPDLAIAKFSSLIEQESTIPFYGDGSTERDYTYVSDIVDGVTKAMNWLTKQKAGTFDVFNLGESRTVSLTRLVEVIEEAVGKKAKIDNQPPQPGDVIRTYADITKAKKTFDYAPSVPIEEGVKKYVEWMRSQPEELED